VKALDLATKAVGVLAAILGTTGYVLVIGAAILWLRLEGVDLPPEVPVSVASRGELIAIGAQAVTVWLVLLLALGGLAAWIVTGDPTSRRFGYPEASLALTVTVSTLFAFESDYWWTIAPAAFAIAYTCYGVWCYWPSLDAVTALMLPLAAGVALGLMLGLLNNRSGFATGAGAASIFAVLMLLTPKLQRWRVRQEANRRAMAHIEAENRAGPDDALEPLAVALRQGPAQRRSPIILWAGRIAVAALALLALGIVSVASQLDHDKNFHKVLISLTNGDCIEGTYVARGSDQVAIGDPNLLDRRPTDDGPSQTDARIATIPTSQVLDVQVYGKETDGAELTRDELCRGHSTQVLVRPAKSDGEN
jgi:hypothetical protein